MHLERIRIQNVKGFGEGSEAVDLDFAKAGGGANLAGWTVVAGPNGCGKTTFLQAIGFTLVEPLLVPSNPGYPWIRQGQAHANVDIMVRRIADDDPPLEGSDDLWFDSQWIEGGVGLDHELPERRIKDRAGYCLVGYGPVRRVMGGIDEEQRVADQKPHLGAMAGLLRNDAFLAESIAWLRDLDYRRLKSDPNAGALLEFVIQLLNDKLLPGEMEITGIEPDSLRIRQRGLDLTLRHLSDGYRTTAAFVIDLVMKMARIYRDRFRFGLEGKTPVVKSSGVVLVDEMELHLHPSWQKQIGFWLKEHFPNVQFIVTTHSPFICQAADCLIRLSPVGTSEPVAVILDEEERKRVVTGGADDAVVSRLFGLPFPHSEIVEEQRNRLATLEARELRGTITEDERAELLRLQKSLPYSPGVSVERILRKVHAPQ